MKYYARVQELLNNAARGAHPYHDGKGRFWEKPLSEFKQLVIYGEQLIADAGPDRGARSNLIKALRGEAPFDDSKFNRMPSGLPPMPPEDIQFIQNWIDMDMPDTEIAGDTSTNAVAAAGSTSAASPPADVTLTQTNAVRNANNQPRIRKNINRLSPEELENYKEAIRQIKALPDEDKRSFNYWASIHANYCRHGTQVFLPWHRAYLIDFEDNLRQFVPGVTIPYWDWVNDREIPKAFLGDESNPLFNARRYPGTEPDSYIPTKEEWNDTQEARTWEIYGGAEFRNGKNERVTHNPMHVWTGGTDGDMTYPPTAAYDPIFWSFHCSVDWQWDLWQKLNTGVGPTTQLDYVLQPFNTMVNQVLTVEQLDYEYGSSESLLLLDRSVPQKSIKITGGVAAASSDVATTVSRVKPRKHTRGMATLQFHQVQHPKESYVVHVFVNQDDAGPDTPIENNPNYAGRFTIWGHGKCFGGEGHCDVPANAREKGIWHHLLPFDIEHDISQCVECLGAYSGKLDVSLVIKVIGDDGKETVKQGGLQCDQISVVSRI